MGTHTRRLVGTLGVIGLLAGACAPSQTDGAGEPRDIVLPIDGQSIDARVPPNATLETLLKHQDVSSETTGLLLDAIRGVFDPRSLRADQSYRITRTLEGIFREFRYQIDADRLLRVVATPGESSFKAEVITMPKEFHVEGLAVDIGKGESLVGVLEARGENVQLALEMANIYGGEVDFNSDLRPGDHADVLFERATRNGQFAGYGQVRAAVLDNDGRRIEAFLFPDTDGRAAYYDETGRSLKRQFLKSPLPFDPRVTSRFSNNRFHPVLGIYRPHLGVDYGAAYGTRVNAVADGVVDFVGTNGEAGRMVRLKHAGGYQTAYLHLSAFAPGLRKGARVSQGDPIGRVGSSGLATGPHLDYRILKNGKYVDPIAELKKMPKGEPIVADRMAAFERARDEARAQLLDLAAAPAPAAPGPTVK
jgi:murein DD-endopeptidase MepM/ murein hydrolase activator NlpD